MEFVNSLIVSLSERKICHKQPIIFWGEGVIQALLLYSTSWIFLSVFELRESSVSSLFPILFTPSYM
jgi:hypothetical protein